MLRITALLAVQTSNADANKQEVETNCPTLTNIDNWGNIQNANTNITESWTQIYFNSQQNF